MMATPIDWPTSYEIARLLVEAARVEGEDALEVLTGKPKSKARLYAFFALTNLFPHVSDTKLMTFVGVPEEQAFQASIVALETPLSVSALKRIILACGWDLPPEGFARRTAADRAAEAMASPLDRRDAIVAPKAPDPPPPLEQDEPAPLEASPLEAPEQVPPPVPKREPAAGMPAAAVAMGRKARPARISGDAASLNYRPTPPAAARGMRVVTATLCGDPAPGRSALDQRIAEQRFKQMVEEAEK